MARAGGTQVEQCPAPAERSGKAHGLDIGVLDQRLANRAVTALHEREHAGVQFQLFPRGIDGLGDNLASTGMGAMALDDDGAASSKRRCGIATGGGEGQREFGRAEHGDRGADGALDHLEVRRGAGLRSGSAAS